MYLPNAGFQAGKHRQYDASGTTTGGASQLILPEQHSRSMLIVQNISDTVMYLEIGCARATAALTSGVVTSVTITNGGFGFTIPPTVEFCGGLTGVTSTLTFAGQAEWNVPGGPFAPSGRPATGVAVLVGGVVNSITISDGGAKYTCPPFVMLHNNRADPFGCADAFFSSAVSGIYLPPGGGSYYVNGTSCPTDALALYCSAASKAFTCKWMP